jgi:hypothetical protein
MKMKLTSGNEEDKDITTAVNMILAAPDDSMMIGLRNNSDGTFNSWIGMGKNLETGSHQEIANKQLKIAVLLQVAYNDLITAVSNNTTTPLDQIKEWVLEGYSKMRKAQDEQKG